MTQERNEFDDIVAKLETIFTYKAKTTVFLWNLIIFAKEPPFSKIFDP